jgi:very-short-patch-repair endonuclease
MSFSRSRELHLIAREVARDLRKSQALAEAILWNALRNRKFCKMKFLRQHPILVKFMDKETFFVADFYCSE